MTPADVCVYVRLYRRKARRCSTVVHSAENVERRQTSKCTIQYTRPRKRDENTHHILSSSQSLMLQTVTWPSYVQLQYIPIRCFVGQTTALSRALSYIACADPATWPRWPWLRSGALVHFRCRSLLFNDAKPPAVVVYKTVTVTRDSSSRGVRYGVSRRSSACATAVV